MINLTKKALSAVLLAPLVFFSIEGAAAARNYEKRTDPTKEVVMHVDNKPFTRAELNIAISKLFPMMSFHSSVPPDRMNQIEKAAINDMIDEEVIGIDAKAHGYTKVDEKEIDAAINNLKKGLRKGQTLEQVLKNSFMTMAQLREHFKNRIIMMHYRQKMGDELRKKGQDMVTDAFMKDYYQNNLSKFKLPPQIRVRTILIKADPGGGPRVWNAALKKADGLAKRARAGEDFAKLAMEYSQDPYAKKGGDMGWVHMGSLFEEIDAAADNMKVGEVSNPIMTIYGYHVIKMVGRKPSVQKKFNELDKKRLRKELAKMEYKKLWDGYIKELRSSHKIKYDAKDVREVMAGPASAAGK